MLDLENRILLRNGKSIITEEDAARHIFTTGKIPENHLVMGDEESIYNYEVIYQRPIGTTDDDFDETITVDLSYTDEDIEFILEHVFSSSRYKKTDAEDSRIDNEMDFFIKSNNINTLLHIIALMKRFKEEKVVWGVGRGSCCSSYVMYLLMVHDVDPIRFNIDFKELSKELEED